MVRFSGMAYAHFTQDFEEWLSNIVRIGEEGDEDEVAVQAPGTPMMEAKHLAQVLRAARISVSSNARLNAQLDALSDTMVQLTGVIQGQTHAVQSVLGGVAELQEHAGILSQAMARNLDTVRSVASGLDARHEVVEATMMLSRQLQSRDQALANSLSTLDQTLSMLRHREAEAARLPTPQSDEAFRLLEELKASLLEGEMGKVRDRLWGEDGDDPTRGERERAPHRAAASQGAAR
jgi:hypothetical protein